MKKLVKPIIFMMSIALMFSIYLNRLSAVTSAPTQGITQIKNLKEEIIKAIAPEKSPAKAKNRKDTFVAAISSPGGVFLPYFYDNGWDGNATDPIFAALVNYDKDGKLVPVLAQKWLISPDQLTYTFYLRKGLKFSDGSPLTAADVAFTLTLLDDPSYSGYIDISKAFIKGGQAYKEGKAGSIEGIKVIDPLTIKITTEKINAQTLFLLGVQVLPKAYYGKGYQRGKLDYLRELYSKPLGAGPYKFEKYVPDQEIRYIANPYYYSGKPRVEHLIYKVTVPETKLQLFQTGETDYDGFDANKDNIDLLKSLGFATIRISTANIFSYVYINNKKPYLKDKLVRQALIYGLDRQKYVEAKYRGYGQVAHVPTSPLSWAYTENSVKKYEFNPEKAKALLTQAGWKVAPDGIREKNGEKLKISYLTRAKDDVFIPIAQENYKAIGIELDPEVMDFNTLVAKLNQGTYDLASVSTSLLTDPDEGVKEFASTFPDNVSGYSNPKVDQLLLESVGTTDLNKRKAVYQELFKELTEDPPIILLNYRKSVAGYNSRIQGLEIDNYTGISSSLAKITIQQ